MTVFGMMQGSERGGGLLVQSQQERYLSIEDVAKK